MVPNPMYEPNAFRELIIKMEIKTFGINLMTLA